MGHDTDVIRINYPLIHDFLQSQGTSCYSGSQFQTHGDQHVSHNHPYQFQSMHLNTTKVMLAEVQADRRSIRFKIVEDPEQ